MASTTPSPRVQQLLAANAEFAKTWSNSFLMKDMRARVGERVFVLTCMDPRVVPEQFLGPDSRVAVYRNAGGRFSSDLVRTLAVIRTLSTGATGFNVMVVHHTDCGMLHLTDDDVKNTFSAHSDHAKKLIEGIDFGFIPPDGLEASIVPDVNAIRREELAEGMNVRGFVLETKTGLLRELDIPEH